MLLSLAHKLIANDSIAGVSGFKASYLKLVEQGKFNWYPPSEKEEAKRTVTQTITMHDDDI